MTDEKKEIFGLTLGDAPALTDYAFNGQTPATTPVLRRVTWQTIKNLFFASVSGYTTIAQADGWTPATGTWTYASATTITVPSGAAAIYSVGDKIKLVQSATQKYFYIVGVADTVLTVTAGTDYTVENAAITFPNYSKVASPIGFPQRFTFAPAFTNLTVVGTPTYTGEFTINGSVLRFVLKMDATTSLESTANSTFCNNLPATAIHGGVLRGVSYADVSPYNSGAIPEGYARAFLPTISASRYWMFDGSYDIL